MEGTHPHERYPWVLVDTKGRIVCPLGSLNPGHWRRRERKTAGPCRCFEEDGKAWVHQRALFHWDES